MTDSTDTPTANEIQINIKGPSELKLQITISTDKTVLDLKHAIAEKSDVEADRQRLIYSGRVLKDDDALSVYKIQSSHTIHMVKGAARNAGSAAAGGSSSTPSAPRQQLPTMQTGQLPSDPLTILNGPMGHGMMAGFNPFADMGLNTNDPNMMQGMLDNPAFLQQMSAMMSNPAIIDQIIASNPQLQAMGPQVRQMFQSEHFRQMMSNPQALQQMLRMSAMMRESGLMGNSPGFGGGLGGLGGFGAGAQSSFPAPGMPSYAQSQSQPQAPPSPTSTTSSSTQATTGSNNSERSTPGPTPGAGAGAGAGGDPLAALASLLGSGAGAGMPGSPNAAATGDPAANPFLFNPLLFPLPNPNASATSPLGSAVPPNPTSPNPFPFFNPYFPPPTSQAAAHTGPPPEERYATQLAALRDMGFTNAAQNVRALLAAGGDVQAAVEYILGGGGV